MCCSCGPKKQKKEKKERKKTKQEEMLYSKWLDCSEWKGEWRELERQLGWSPGHGSVPTPPCCPEM